MTSADAQVLVAGAGPVGLAMAIELLRHGTPCRLIEQSPAAPRQSRASDIHARTLDAFANMGVYDKVISQGHKRFGVRLAVDGQPVGAFSLAEQDANDCFDIGLSQKEIETILEARLEALGGRVERGVRLASIEPRDDGVKATLLRPDGRWEERTFGWVVGCDGARSTVRRWLDVTLEGSTSEEAFFLADADVETDISRDDLTIFASAHGMVCYLPMPGARSFRIFGELDLDRPPPDSIDAGFLQRISDARAVRGPRIVDAGWTAVFRVCARMVKEYRHGRVFLAGDAAHIHGPIGGHGMNTGIQDAFNLGWKLALVAQGRANDSLLDSYTPERAPVARAVLDDTEAMTKRMIARNPFARLVLSQGMPLVSRLPGARRRAIVKALEIGVSYRESPAVDEYLGSLLDVTWVSRRDTEAASVRERMEFSGGPQPGDHAPDVAVESDGARSLFDVTRGPMHSLLLFDGDAPTAEGYRNLEAIVQLVARRWGSLVKCWIVVPRTERPKELLTETDVVIDKRGAVHKRYGATKECLYLIRPDGYIAFRSQPADCDALQRYLEHWFVG